MNGSRSFAVVAYPDRSRAEQALKLIEELAHGKHVRLADAAIVVKSHDGRLELFQTREVSVGQGAVTGGVAGFLLGFALGGPVGGALAGMVSGGAFGAFDTGIENERLKELGESLAPAQAALGLLIEEADWGLLRERLATLGGELLVSELTPEAAAALDRLPPSTEA
jgi:uncharacterized membrane protein